jgi:hypothetical protein
MLGQRERKRKEKERRLEMSDFERFGLICDEWLEAAKEDISDEEDN